jgi:hypothetical protein
MARARDESPIKDAKGARAWAKDQGLSAVYLVLDAKATRSDPSHVVSVRSFREVDRQLVAWLRQAYDRAT